MTDPRQILVDPEAEAERAKLEAESANADSINEAPVVETLEYVAEGKYAGKSVQDLVEMHQNAEKAIGTKNDELGQWRTLALDRQEDTAELDEAESVELTSDNLIDSPNESIRAVIQEELRAAIAPIREELDLDAEEKSVTRFNTAHEDAAEVAGSDEFKAWVQRSAYRRDDANQASQGNLAVAGKLLTEFKADQGFFTQSAEPETAEVVELTEGEAAVEAARQAATETGGAGGPVTTKRTFTSVEITNMVNNDFAAYSDPAFQAELAEAIKDGRVSGL